MRLLVDLFDLPHARHVLAEFGRAHGQLPASPSVLNASQEAFLVEAVESLADDGRVICVRLALFAEMMKSRPWTPSTLRQLGGEAGVGSTFLEETFSGPAAPPPTASTNQPYARSSSAAAELPGPTSRDTMRPRQELLQVSGYATQPERFHELLRILDNDLRLITPAGQTTETDELGSAEAEEPQWQLTHDYLVPGHP
ncbi:MAG: hypothetical protein R3B96_02410 [Pirellulaceae bacterium]